MSTQANVTDSINYLDTVKATLPSAAYDEFVQTLSQFRTGRQVVHSRVLKPMLTLIHGLPVADVLARTSDLFSGRPAIVPGLNAFLPPGFAIACSDDGKTITVTTPAGETTRAYP
ncbi:hypothetical protein B0H17DRAFT_557628 [Mycena rosella]|uniref:Uncharacterized protein n=1 Tax=Mycena rosella TaxID=1033263 RepID=A0AAD7DHC6_MYCRO|nr:hypothetical protein B0H17DRAFT_557628 [Mycena rosella]